MRAFRGVVVEAVGPLLHHGLVVLIVRVVGVVFGVFVTVVAGRGLIRLRLVGSLVVFIRRCRVVRCSGGAGHVCGRCRLTLRVVRFVGRRDRERPVRQVRLQPVAPCGQRHLHLVECFDVKRFLQLPRK